jgi:hypothetical protein
MGFDVLLVSSTVLGILFAKVYRPKAPWTTHRCRNEERIELELRAFHSWNLPEEP